MSAADVKFDGGAAVGMNDRAFDGNKMNCVIQRSRQSWLGFYRGTE
jgi:hypothetical protein